MEKELEEFCFKQQRNELIKQFLEDLDDINQDNRADYLVEKYNNLIK